MSDRVDDPVDPAFATSLGAARGEVRDPPSPARKAHEAVKPPVDLSDPAAVAQLAVRVATGTRRSAEWLSVDEVRAIARLAVAVILALPETPKET